MSWPLRIFIIVFISFTAILLYMWIAPPTQVTPVTEQPRAASNNNIEGLYHIVALDTQHTNQVNTEAVLAGEAGILLLKTNPPATTTTTSPATPTRDYIALETGVIRVTPLAPEETIFANTPVIQAPATATRQGETYVLFHKLSAIANFDLNQDSMITANDPIYANLYIGHINQVTKELEIFPLAKSSIVALHFNHEHLSHELNQDPKHYSLPLGKLTHTDGTSGKMYLVEINPQEITRLTISMPENKVQPGLLPQ